MEQPQYIVDAFTNAVFSGNPAAVCPLDDWLPDATMAAIARENNLSETAFIVGARGAYAIRWFTPSMEVDLCGHATLASAFVVFNYLYPIGQPSPFKAGAVRSASSTAATGSCSTFPPGPVMRSNALQRR